jgi:antitoxin PrlF
VPISKMSVKGQLTVPAEIRKAVKAVPGTQFLWVLMHDGTIRVIAKTVTLEDLAGMLKPAPGIKVSLDEMNPFR